MSEINEPGDGAQAADASPGDQVKGTFSELGSSSDNLGDGAEDEPPEEEVRDWPPLHT